ncbi:MAG: hypothetical protein AAGI68_16135 [Planctomycetota bacterium]
MPIFDNKEQAAIRALAKIYSEGMVSIPSQRFRQVAHDSGFVPEGATNAAQLLQTCAERLKAIGALTDVTYALGVSGPLGAQIDPYVVDLARGIDKAEADEQRQAERVAKQIIDSRPTLLERFKKHWIVGLIVITAATLVALATIATGIDAFLNVIERLTDQSASEVTPATQPRR